MCCTQSVIVLAAVVLDAGLAIRAASCHYQYCCHYCDRYYKSNPFLCNPFWPTLFAVVWLLRSPFLVNQCINDILGKDSEVQHIGFSSSWAKNTHIHKLSEFIWSLFWGPLDGTILTGYGSAQLWFIQKHGRWVEQSTQRRHLNALTLAQSKPGAGLQLSYDANQC